MHPVPAVSAQSGWFLPPRGSLNIFYCPQSFHGNLSEQGFTSKRADEEDMKRILAVYFEQNVTTEKFEEFDGERWIILNE